MEETDAAKLLSIDDVWDNFCTQLQEAKQNLKLKEDELEQEAANLTRIDLTEYNNHKIIVTKLEAAVETLDIVRVSVFGQPSKIEIK